MTWEIVLGIISLVSALGLVCGWTGKLYKTITTLDVTIKMLKEMLEEFRADAKETHTKMSNKIEDCERRISAVERKIGQ